MSKLPASSMSRLILTIWFTVILILSSLDIHSTYVCLSTEDLDVKEANPWMAWLINKLGLIYGLLLIGSAIKLIFVVVSTIVFSQISLLAASIDIALIRILSKIFVYFAMLTYTWFSAVVVINNYSFILSH